MKTATIIVKTEPKVKKDAVQVAREMGVPLSVLVNAQLKNLIRDRKVTLSAPYKMTPRLEKIIEKVEKDRKIGKNMAGPFSSVSEMRAYLES